MITKMRYCLAIMLCIANMIIYGMKVNTAVTIVGMVKKSKPSQIGIVEEHECPQYLESSSGSASNIDIEGPYDWSSKDQGNVNAVYFAGYLIGMFPCGYFVDRFNAKWALTFCVFSSSLLTLSVPFVAKWLNLLLAVRFLTGIIGAANLPLVNVFVGRWVMYEEKSMWLAIIYGGTSLGTVISIFTTGWIMSWKGWEMVFYIHGILPLIWVVVFTLVFAESPETQVYITEEERNMLINTFGHRGPSGAAGTKKVIPWKKIFTSKPFIALIFTNFFANFTWYLLLITLPTYMNKMLKYDIKTNASVTCVPYLISAIFNTGLGRLLDYGRRKAWWGPTNARKLAVGISCVPAVILLLVISYLGCDRDTTTLLLCLNVVVSGVIFVGHLSNHNDLAPNFSGVLMGITNTPGSISAYLNPVLAGIFTESGHTFANWRKLFFINIIAQSLGFLTFMIFGSGEIQDWNYVGGPAAAPPPPPPKPAN